MRSVRACRGFLASFLVLLGAPRSGAADRCDQRKGHRNRRLRAPRSDGRGPLRRPARTPPDGHGRNGEYRLPALPPGAYTVKFDLAGMQSVTRKAEVQLAQDTVADAKLGVSGIAETVTVTAEASLLDKESATIASGLSNEQIRACPSRRTTATCRSSSPACSTPRTPSADRAPAAADRTTSTSSTASTSPCRSSARSRRSRRPTTSPRSRS